MEKGKTYTATKHVKRRIFVRLRAKKPLFVVVNAMVYVPQRQSQVVQRLRSPSVS